MTTTSTAGPDFVSFQVRDLDAAATFYTDVVGLNRLPAPNKDAVVFATGPGSTAFAVRTPLPGVDLDAASPALGHGIGVWFHSSDPEEVLARVTAAGARIVGELFVGPFGPQFTFVDLDGYAVTVHGDAA